MAAPDRALFYILDSLALGPRMTRHLLQGLPESADRTTGDPERFNFLQIVAHMADWDGITHDRIARILNEDHPSLPDLDEGARAVEQDYEQTSLPEWLDRFDASRHKLVNQLKGLNREQWDRVGHREGVGDMTVYEYATYFLAHDGYHFRQILDYRRDLSL